MASKLVIVESPAKAKTLSKFLGSDYSIKASMGHVRDLPDKELAVDIKKEFKPKYVVIPNKKKTVTDLKNAAEKAKEILIATDPDREGEAIGWHIAYLLNKVQGNIKRVMFNEITKNAVKQAVENPIDIDKDKVDAQQARRILDRLVGYLVSEQLWKVIARGLSAGRVQSVALRILVEREEEIEAFVPEEYWQIFAASSLNGTPSFRMKLVKIDGKEAKINNGEFAGKIVEDLKTKPASLFDIRSRIVDQKVPPPFITSTLQQEAARRLNFNVKRTMSVAQRLYEGIELGDAGSVGLITYMRTDSFRVSDTATNAARDYIKHEYGDEYLSPKPRVFGKKGRSQDAHEAIRPTSFEWTPKKVKQFLKPEQFRLYELIWNRFLATQMANAKFESVSVEVSVDDNGGLTSKNKNQVPGYLLRATGKKLLFPGFYRLWGEMAAEDAKEDEERTELPDIFFKNISKDGAVPELGAETQLSKIESEQKFTQPPYRYSESMLVKALDEKGIGRPSTYAQIISTLVDRKYVERQKKKLHPTELGRTVNKILVKEFNDVFNVEYTARMEEALDKVEEGSSWVSTVQEFWEPFKLDIEKFKERKSELKKETMIKTGRSCPQCDEGELVERFGRFGKFISCDRFPKCKYTEKINGEAEEKQEPESTGRTCPTCEEGDLLIRQGRYGKFISCSRYPKCKYTEKIAGEEGAPGAKKDNLPDVNIPCPREGCGGTIISKRTRRGKIFYSCTNWKEKKCKVAFWDMPVLNECNSCGYAIRTIKGKNLVCPECNSKEPYEAENAVDSTENTGEKPNA